MQAYNARSVALQAILSTVLDKKNLNVAVDNLKHQQDKSLAKSLSFGVIRYYHWLNNVVNAQLKKPIHQSDLDLHGILLLGAYQLLLSHTSSYAAIFETVNLATQVKKTWAKPLINAVLRRIDAQKEVILSQIDDSHPSWLSKKIKQTYPTQYKEILAQNNIQAPMSIRLHPKLDIKTYQTQLNKANIHSKTVDILPYSLVLNPAVSVDKLPDFDQGVCYVQDCSAQLAGHLLSPKNNETILDACAAPGGKTLHLAELAPKAKITALESDAKRIKRLVDNIQKHSQTKITIKQGLAQHQDWWNGVLFDKILLDAPCSATGIIRRHPDIKLLRKPKDITQLVKLQTQILDNLWQLLKPGGTLLYATCSILPIENTQQIANFLNKYPEAQEVNTPIKWGHKAPYGLQQLPHKHFDGFYYCLLLKNHYHTNTI